MLLVVQDGSAVIFKSFIQLAFGLSDVIDPREKGKRKQ